MPATLIRLDSRQKARLSRRAKLRGHTVSEELRYAIDLYLLLSPDADRELEQLARAANKAANRSVKRLDKTIALVDRVLEKISARRRSRSETAES
jgi:hypothetical protein